MKWWGEKAMKRRKVRKERSKEREQREGRKMKNFVVLETEMRQGRRKRRRAGSRNIGREGGGTKREERRL